MKPQSVLNQIKSEIKPKEEDIQEIKNYLKIFTDKVKQEVKKQKIKADLFIGGSFAKGTLLRGDIYEVDILLRFYKNTGNISEATAKVIKNISSSLDWRFERIHGSRDYFRIFPPRTKVLFEIIPVIKISSPGKAENVTDLSYFHVSYVRRKAARLGDEIRLAKAFCQAQGMYGAESYIQGFSGYGLECLIIKYKSFLSMLRELSKTKDRIVIDSGKHYKNSNEVLFKLNESKLHSPVILIDPTFKERNALASLSMESFAKFQKAAKDFLSKPSENYFVEKKINADRLEDFARKNKAEFIHIIIRTNRQAGDIAGTKLKKFHYWLEREISKPFSLIKHEFEYDGKQAADVYLIVKAKKDLVRVGPPLAMKNHVMAFKKAHKKTFVKNGILHAKIPVNYSGKEMIRNIEKDKDNLKEQSITELKIEN